MDLPAQPSLLAKLTQPSTLFAIACVSVSFLALRSAWKNGASPVVNKSSHKHTQKSSDGQRGSPSVRHSYQTRPNPPQRATVDRNDSISILSECVRSFYRILGHLFSVASDEDWFREVRSVLERQIELCINSLRDLEQALHVLNDPLELELDTAAALKTVTIGFGSVCTSFDGHVQRLKQHEGAQQGRNATTPESLSLSQFAGVLSSVHENLAAAKSLTQSLRQYARPNPT